MYSYTYVQTQVYATMPTERYMHALQPSSCPCGSAGFAKIGELGSANSNWPCHHHNIDLKKLQFLGSWRSLSGRLEPLTTGQVDSQSTG